MDQVSLANVSAGAPVWSRSCAAAAADGVNPITWPPCRATRELGAHGGGFPGAGAIASCSRAPEVHMERTRAACPASRDVPVGGGTQRQLDGVSVQDASVDLSGRDESLLRGQDPAR